MYVYVCVCVFMMCMYVTTLREGCNAFCTKKKNKTKRKKNTKRCSAALYSTLNSIPQLYKNLCPLRSFFSSSRRRQFNTNVFFLASSYLTRLRLHLK